jgi:hypothetical protein
VSVLIESRGERAIITGDMCHHPVQWAEPHWSTVADVDADRGAATRRQFLGDYTDDRRTLIIGTHYPTPCAGYLRRDGDRTIFK